MNPESLSPPPSKLSCRSSDELKAFFDGELSFWQARKVRAHVRLCQQCREELAMIQTITEELQKESEESVGLAPELRAQILDAARQTTPGPTSPAPQVKMEPVLESPPRDARRPPKWEMAVAFVLLMGVGLSVMTLTGGKIKSTFNKAADSISIGDDSYAPSPSFQRRASGVPNGAASESSGIGGPITLERQVHKQGSLTVAVDSVERSSDEVMRIIKNAGGFIANNSLSSEGGRYAQLETRVPVAKFEDVVRVIGGLGQVQAKSISGEDITGQYVTVQARRDVLDRELAVRTAQLRALQAKASQSNSDERQQMQYQIVRLRTQTAEVRARFEALRKLAVLSSLSVTLREKTPAVAPATLGQDLSKTGREAWASLLVTARIPLTLLIYILAYSPLWLPALFLWRRYAPPPHK